MQSGKLCIFIRGYSFDKLIAPRYYSSSYLNAYTSYMTTITKVPVTKSRAAKARMLSLAGDQTRIRILCLLFEHKQVCVSEIATALDMSVASISHHLQLMKDAGFFTTERRGNTICYSLNQSVFIKQLQKIICT